MALLRDAANEGAHRTTNLFAIGPFTACGFFNFNNFTVAGTPYQAGIDANNLFNINVSTGGNAQCQFRATSGTDYLTGTIAVSTGIWYFWAITLNSANTVTNMYIRAVNATGALTAATAGAPVGTGFTPTFWRCGFQGVAPNFLMAGYRMWAAELTSEELELESRQTFAKRVANCRGIYPMLGTDLTAAYRDFSVDNTALTTASVAPTVDLGPSVPWRFSRHGRRVSYVVASAPGGSSPPGRSFLLLGVN